MARPTIFKRRRKAGDEQSDKLYGAAGVANPVVPSTRKLAIGSMTSLLVAVVLLVVAVLPAEYGIDPTGLGQLLGLRSLSARASVTATPDTGLLGADTDLLAGSTPLMDVAPVWKRDMPFRLDEISLTLLPNEGAEVKAQMRQGERLFFGWTVEGGKVNFDMHGEAANAPPDTITSYWRGKDRDTGNGAFVAPSDGTHGWYWENRGERPVTIVVKTSGYYERLYRLPTPTTVPRAEASVGQGTN